jgi:Holliday junction resolvase RusA-like endonuclease
MTKDRLFNRDKKLDLMYEVFVDGVPKPQPRPRMTRQGRVYTPSTADAWKDAVKTAFTRRLKPKIGIPVYLSVHFYLPCPKRVKPGAARPPHTGKPDIDNLLKSTMDALTVAGVWEDDAQVIQTAAEKHYAEEKTGAWIRIGI